MVPLLCTDTCAGLPSPEILGKSRIGRHGVWPVPSKGHAHAAGELQGPQAGRRCAHAQHGQHLLLFRARHPASPPTSAPNTNTTTTIRKSTPTHHTCILQCHIALTTGPLKAHDSGDNCNTTGCMHHLHRLPPHMLTGAHQGGVQTTHCCARG